MTLMEFHGFEDSIRWRLVPAGVEIEGSGVERTRSMPVTATRVWEMYAAEINRMARATRVPCALIVATICTESSGRADAVRLEPGYISDVQTPHKVSAGLTQTLLSTARESLQMSFDRTFLLNPAGSIEAGTAYIAQQARLTRLDPPFVAAAYNAGRLVYQSGAKNRWKLRQYPIGTGAHCDRFIQFFNDAVFVLNRHSVRPAVGLESLLGEPVVTPRYTPAPKTQTSTAPGSPGSQTILSSIHWVSQFPGSTKVKDLEASFRANVERFIAALESAGATVKIKSSYRPPERAYLMHWSWKIAKEDSDAQKVPPLAGVNINWWHGDQIKSKQAAQEMVDGYGITRLKIPPALVSRHTERKAIDTNISWKGDLKIKQADETEKIIKSIPRDETNPDLIEVGKTYGVIHFKKVENDRVHWSTDGR